MLYFNDINEIEDNTEDDYSEESNVDSIYEETEFSFNGRRFTANITVKQMNYKNNTYYLR